MDSTKEMSILECEGGGSEVGGSRAKWTPEGENLFCDLCIEFLQKSKGKSGATVAQSMPWKSLELKFQKMANLPYTQNQLKHKWDWMKKRWSLYKKLKGNETGLGYDHEKQTVLADEEWWKYRIEENILYKKFKDEGIEKGLEAKMDQLFGVSVAQGKHRFTPVQRGNESAYFPSPPINMNVSDASFVSDDEINGNNTVNSTHTEKEWHQVWSDDDVSPVSSPLSQFTQPSVTTTRSGKKRAVSHDVPEASKKHKSGSSKKKGSGMVLEKIDTLLNVVTERNNKDMKLMDLEARSLGDSSISVGDCLAKLAVLDGLILGSPEFCFACTLIEDPQKRIILNGMPDDYSRLQWIKYLYKKSEEKGVNVN